MGGLFGKQKSGHSNGQRARDSKVKRTPHSEMSTKDQAILKLKIARDRLEKTKKRHESELMIYHNKAKELLKENKIDQAKLALKTKKYKTRQIEVLDGQLLNLVQLVNDVEWAEKQVEVIEGIKAGTEALKELNELMPIEKVEKILEDSREALEQQKEINDLLSGTLTEDDETEVDAEYDAILNELRIKNEMKETKVKSDSTAAKINTPINLPDAPTKEPKLSPKDTKEEIREQQKEPEAVPA